MIFILILISISTARVTQVEHQYWTTFDRKDIVINDQSWNYCDLKCLYFQNLVPNTDFYVINFKNKLHQPDFSACYARKLGGTPKIWNKIAQNQWFYKNCGNNDIKDWAKEGYQQKNIQGQGIGTQIYY